MLCVLFQNNVATQVYEIVVTVHSEEAIQAGMEWFIASNSTGLHSWTQLLWKDSWKRPLLRGLGAVVKGSRVLSPAPLVISESVRKPRSFICWENAGAESDELLLAIHSRHCSFTRVVSQPQEILGEVQNIRDVFSAPNSVRQVPTAGGRTWGSGWQIRKGGLRKDLVPFLF